MIKKYLAICVCLFAIADVLGQTRSKSAKQRRPVKQPPEVVEAYRVCNEFQQMLAENFDFERAFEATFTKIRRVDVRLRSRKPNMETAICRRWTRTLWLGSTRVRRSFLF